MPYSSTKSLPPAAKNLPEAAKKIWLAAFNASFERYGEQKAFAIAMAAVKNKYRQVNGKWMAKDAEPELPLADRDLPLEVKAMPAAARAIFKATFRKALREEPDQMAAMLALAAVKKEFTMEGEEWVKKEEAEAARAREAAELAAAAGEAAGDPDDPEAGEGTGEGSGEASEARGGSGEASSEGGSRKKARKAGAGEPGAYSKTTKTTETTETRGGATDSIQMTEVFALDAPTSERFGMRTTASGYLVAEPRVARIGIQLYKGHEVGRPDMDEVRVYRPETEVFDTRAMSSLAHRPVTFNHPDTNVDPSNWREFSVGHSTGDVARDGDFIRVPLALMDQAAIDAAKSGHSQLSVGYGAKLVWGQGETSDGQLYDAMQTDIRANHIALVRTARGGDKLRMGDNSHEKRRSPMTDRTINLDGVNVALEDKDAQILERHLSGLNKKLVDQGEEATALKKKITEMDAALAKATGDAAAKDGEIVVLKKKVEDGKLTDEEVDRRVHERLLIHQSHVVAQTAKFTPSTPSIERS